MIWTDTELRNGEICNLYVSGKYKVEDIAKRYGLTPRSVQRIMKKMGVVRTHAEAQKVAAPLKNYYRMPEHLKATRKKRKSLDNRVRLALVREQPYCTYCGARPADGIRLEVDHVDNDPTNNALSNLQVLCGPCNRGKSHIDRWGMPEDLAA